MLDDDHSGAVIDQCLEYTDECPDVQRVQADGGLVEDEHRIRLCLSHLACQLQALCLAAGETGRLFSECQVSQSQVLQDLETLADGLQMLACLQR